MINPSCGLFMCGIKQSTVYVSGPQNKLAKEVKMVALSGYAIDGFTWTLLKLARFADSLNVGGAPILKHHFSKEEYTDAKKKIEELIDTKKKEKRAKSRRDTKDLEFDHLFENQSFS